MLIKNIGVIKFTDDPKESTAGLIVVVLTAGLEVEVTTAGAAVVLTIWVASVAAEARLTRTAVDGVFTQKVEKSLTYVVLVLK